MTTPRDIAVKANLAMEPGRLRALSETLLCIASQFPAADVLAAEAAIRNRREYLESPEWQAMLLRN